MVIAAMKLKDTPWKKSYDQPRNHIKKQRHYFANKGLSRQGYGFSSGHVWMWELDYKESWALKNWCFWIVAEEARWCCEAMVRPAFLLRRCGERIHLNSPPDIFKSRCRVSWLNAISVEKGKLFTVQRCTKTIPEDSKIFLTSVG